jgi:hypothetical protein
MEFSNKIAILDLGAAVKNATSGHESAAPKSPGLKLHFLQLLPVRSKILYKLSSV